MMFRKLAKLLPYAFLIWFAKQFSPNFITTELGICCGFRIDKGEWILFSQQNYDRMNEQMQRNKKKKLSRKQKMYEKLKRELEG